MKERSIKHFKISLLRIAKAQKVWQIQFKLIKLKSKMEILKVLTNVMHGRIKDKPTLTTSQRLVNNYK